MNDVFDVLDGVLDGLTRKYFDSGEPLFEIDGTRVWVEDHPLGLQIRVLPWSDAYRNIVGFGNAIPMQTGFEGKPLVFTDPIKAAKFVAGLKAFLENVKTTRDISAKAATLRRGGELLVYYGKSLVVNAHGHMGKWYVVEVSGLPADMVSLLIDLAITMPGVHPRFACHETNLGWFVEVTFREAVDATRFYTEVAR